MKRYAIEEIRVLRLFYAVLACNIFFFFTIFGRESLGLRNLWVFDVCPLIAWGVAILWDTRRAAKSQIYDNLLFAKTKNSFELWRWFANSFNAELDDYLPIYCSPTIVHRLLGRWRIGTREKRNGNGFPGDSNALFDCLAEVIGAGTLISSTTTNYGRLIISTKYLKWFIAHFKTSLSL